MSRAQLAWNLLQHVLPSELRRSGSENLKEQAPEIISWYNSLKDATPADLALAYLEAGDGGQEIIKLAMEVTDPKKFARLENSMLEQAQIYDMSNLVPFVEKLGPEKGPAFVAKVRQKLDAELSRYSDNDQGARQRKQMESSLKRLEKAAKGGQPDVKELLAVLAAYDSKEPNEDEMEVREAFQTFPKLMSKRSVAERLDLILPVLQDFKSAVLALSILNFALHGEESDGAESLKAEDRLALLERTRSHWQRLLDMPSGEPEEQPMGMLIRLVSSLERLVTGKMQPDVIQQLSYLGDRGENMLRQRAAALLAGEKVEPLPRADDIKSDERQKLLAEWSKKTAAEISRDLETLPVDRLLALNETLIQSKDIPDNFKSYIGHIQMVKIKGLADAAPWQAYQGKAWSKETLVELARQVSAFGGGRLVVELQRNVPLFGFKLQVSEVQKFGGNWQVLQMVRVMEGRMRNRE